MTAVSAGDLAHNGSRRERQLVRPGGTDRWL